MAVFEDQALERRSGAKIQEYPHLDGGCPEVIEKLCMMDFVQHLDGLALYDDRVRDNEVRPKHTYRPPPEPHSEPRFSVERDARLREPDGQSLAIHRFEKATPEFVVNVEEDSKHRICYMSMEQRRVECAYFTISVHPR